MDDEKPERHTLQPLIAYFINQQQQLLNNAPTQAGPGDKQDKSEKDKVDKHDKEKDNHHHHHQHTHVNAVSAASSFPGNDDFLDDFFDMEVAPPEYDIRQGLAGGDDIFPLFSFSTKPSMGYQSSASKLLSAMDQQGDNSSNSWPSPADLSSFSFYVRHCLSYVCKFVCDR